MRRHWFHGPSRAVVTNRLRHSQGLVPVQCWRVISPTLSTGISTGHLPFSLGQERILLPWPGRPEMRECCLEDCRPLETLVEDRSRPGDGQELMRRPVDCTYAGAARLPARVAGLLQAHNRQLAIPHPKDCRTPRGRTIA